MRPRLFVGSSREAIRISRAVQAELDDDFQVTVWNQDVFRPSYSALDSLLETLDSSDAGVFIFRPDDLTVRQGTTESTVRDNVLLELGLFVGRLGRDRTFLMTPRGVAFHLPSDLFGLITVEYDPGRPERELRAAVGSACTTVRERLGRLELRAIEEPESRRRLDRAMSRMSRDRRSDRTDSVVALPANEYFDDECITDTNSSLGAFVQDVFGPEIDAFLAQVRAQLDGLPSQRVPRGPNAGSTTATRRCRASSRR